MATYEEDVERQDHSGPLVFTAEQVQKNRLLYQRVQDLVPLRDANKTNDCDLMYRFLIGRQWNVVAADKFLREYLVLREEKHLDTILGEHVHERIAEVLSLVHGVDKEGLPILWMTPDPVKLMAAMKEFSSESLLRAQMRIMEIARFISRHRHVDRCTYVLNLGKVTVSSVNKATLAFVRELTHMLQGVYPEIMRRLLIYNTGWAVTGAWKVLRPFIDTRVQDKIKFFSGPPTVETLKEFVSPDQVVPSFGGSSSFNVLEAAIQAEAKRQEEQLHRRLSGALLSPLNSAHRQVSRAASMSGAYDDDTMTLHSLASSYALSTTAYQSPRGDVEECHGRLLIGVPGAVSAWGAMESAGSSSAPKRGPLQQDESQSISESSHSEDYTTNNNTTAAVEVPLSSSASARALASPRGFIGCGKSTVKETRGPASPVAAGVASESSENVVADGGAVAVGEGHQEPVCLHLTQSGGGAIVAFHKGVWVGMYRNNLLYTEDVGDGQESVPTSPAPETRCRSSCSGSPATALPSDDRDSPENHLLDVSLVSRNADVPWRHRVSGELLNEAGHPVHIFMIVCDGHRRARFVIRTSRLRTRLTIFSVVGDRDVRTSRKMRHYLEGDRVRMAVVVPHSTASKADKGSWMLYGEDLTSLSAGQSASSDLPPSKKPAKKGSARSWGAAVRSAIRSSTGTGKAAQGGSESERSVAVSDSMTAAAAAAVAPLQVPRLMAEGKGQSVFFYGAMARYPMTDLFAIAVAITLSWSNDGLISVSSSRTSRKQKDNSSSDSTK